MRFRLLTEWKVHARTGQTVVLRKKEREVLVCLVLSLLSSDHVDKQVVHAVIWPEEPMRRQLDNQLSNLRAKLPDDVPLSNDRSGNCRLAIDRSDIDVWRFFDLAQQAQSEGNMDAWPEALSCWPRVSSLPLPAEHPATATLEDMYVHGLRDWSAELLLRGKSKDAIPLLAKIVEFVPEDIHAWTTLVQQTAATAGRPAALLVLHKADAQLTSLGSPPGEILRQGHSAIQNALQGRPIAVPPKLQSLRATILGEVSRKTELSSIKKRLENSVAAVLEGVPGNGKSWLADHTALESDLNVFRWTFRPSQSDSPANLLNALSRHLQSAGSGSLAKLLEREKVGAEQFDALWWSTVIAESFQEVPTLMILDDFHVVGGESGTLHLLRELLRRLQESSTTSRLLVVSRVAPTNLLDESVPGTVYGITKPEAVNMLLELGVELTPDQMTTLYAWTSGNLKLLRMFAGWVTETRATSEEIDALLDRPSRWINARSYLLSNFISDFSPELHSLVVSLALLRSPVCLPGLWAAAGELGLKPVDTVEGLVRRHILEISPGGAFEYSLHGLTRDFLRDAFDGTDKKKFHVLAAVIQKDSASLVEELFHVGESGNRALAHDRLFHSANEIIEAGQVAQMLDLLELWGFPSHGTRIDIAILHCELLRMVGRLRDAEELFQRVSQSAVGATRIHALLGRATTLKALSRWPAALRDIESASSALDAGEGDTLLKGTCLTLAGSVMAQVGDFDDARGSLVAGLELLRQSPVRPAQEFNAGASALVQRPEQALGEGLCSLGWLELMAGQLGRAEKILRDAVGLQERISDNWGRSESLGLLGRCLWQTARWVESEEVQNESLTLARSLGNVRQEALAFRHLGLLAWNAGNGENAMLSTSTALASYVLIGDRYGEAGCLENQAAILFDANDYPGARDLIETAQDICHEIGAMDFLAYAVLYEAKIITRVGDPERGLALAEEAVRLLQARRYSLFYWGMAVRARAEALLLLGRLDEARGSLLAAADAYVSIGSPYQAAKCQFWLSHVAAASGDVVGGSATAWEVVTYFRGQGAMRDLRRAEVWLLELSNR